MEGLQKFLQILNDNWTSKLAKKQIQTTILKMISDAEVDWQEWSKAGSIKRSQVIKQIYEEYPILTKVVDQDALIKYIDEQIDGALDTLREIVKTNEAAS